MSGNNGNKLMQRISYACGTFGHDIFYMMVSTYLSCSSQVIFSTQKIKVIMNT